MKDYLKRIDNDDYNLGLGILVSNIIGKDIFQDYPEDEKNFLTVQTIASPEQAEEMVVTDKLEEIRSVCMNEEMRLIASKYFFASGDKNVSVFRHLEFIVLKDLDFRNNDVPDQKLAKTISDLMRYFEVKTPPYFFIYFDEHIIIDEEGDFHSIFKVQTEYEHLEEFGNHEED